jgi:hypothetical protein
MTGSLSARRRGQRLPTPPTGWPIGSYSTYEEAQRAVDHLADHDFPVQEVTIVGVDLMTVERVVGRLSWGRALTAGAGTGAWLGLFVGLLLSFFDPGGDAAFVPILAAIGIGILFGAAFGAAGYASSRGIRDFQSTSQLVAGRYDVLSQPHHAEQGRDMLAKLAMGSPGQL